MAARPGPQNVIDGHVQFVNGLALVVAADLAMQNALAPAFDQKLRAESVERIMGLGVEVLRRSPSGNRRKGAAHRVLAVGQRLFLMARRAFVVADVRNVGMNVLKRTRVAEARIARMVGGRRTTPRTSGPKSRRREHEEDDPRHDDACASSERQIPRGSRVVIHMAIKTSCKFGEPAALAAGWSDKHPAANAAGSPDRG